MTQRLEARKEKLRKMAGAAPDQRGWRGAGLPLTERK